MIATTQIIEVRVDELTIHPSSADVPRMRPDEWAPFLADVSRRGVQEPIVVQGGGVVLDGRHRLEAAQLHGDETIPARVVNLSEDEQADYAIKAALHRRHLSDDQRAVLAARTQQAMSKAARSDQAKEAGSQSGRVRRGEDPPANAEDASSPTFKPRTRTQAAQQFNVPEKKVRRAIAVQKHSPELASQVLAGEIPLQEAAKQVENTTAQRNGQKRRIRTVKEQMKGKDGTCVDICESLLELTGFIKAVSQQLTETNGSFDTHSFDLQEQISRLRLASKLLAQVRSAVKGA